MKSPNTRLFVICIVVFCALAIGSLAAIKHSSLARPSDGNQGTLFFGFSDVQLGISGTPATAPITDWSFVDAAQTVQIETHPWWRIPYTVRICAARVGDQLYLLSDYKAPVTPGEPDLRDSFPSARGWNRNLLRDSRIRVNVGDRLITGVAQHVPDPPGPVPDVSLGGTSEYERVRAAFIDKYDWIRNAQAKPPEQRNKMQFFRVTPRWGA